MTFFAVVSSAWRPTSLLPALAIRDISQLDWSRLKALGYTGVVLDKDNCLTMPLHDELVPELQHSFKSLLRAFGVRNVLIVSNSAGTSNDPAFIQAESVARTLGAAVLLHPGAKKPSKTCAHLVAQFFSQGPASFAAPANYPIEEPPLPSNSNKLLVIGDRVATDIVLANRLPLEADGILTTRLWQREGLLSTTMRAFEWLLYRLISRWHSVTYSEKQQSLKACLRI